MFENKLREIDLLQKEINQFRPLKKHELKELKEYYRIGLTYTSNAIEGNSLTQTETKIILEEGITIGGKLLKDHYEVVGHSQAYDLLYKFAKRTEIKERDILNLHKFFYYRIDNRFAGKYRKERVFITGTEFVPPAANEIPVLMKDLVQNMPNLQRKFHSVEYAALVHKKLVMIHPFIDGNGRTARLLMNLILLQQGYVVTIIPPIVRRDYIDALDKSRKDDTFFISFISSMVYESQKDYLRLLRLLRENN